MLQELFRIHLPFSLPVFGREIPLYGYGLMLVIGFLLATQLAKFLARRSDLDAEAFVNGALLALISGIIGARISHILENLPEFTRSDRSAMENLLSMVNLSSGGLTYYGGFLLAFPTMVIYALKKRIPLALGMDIIAPCLMIGLGFGRIGCLLNGCCYGAACDLPWAVHFPYYTNAYVDQFDNGGGPLKPPDRLVKVVNGQIVLRTPAEIRQDPELEALRRQERSLGVHPVQLYSSFTAFLLAGLLLAYFTLPRRAGRVFALMLMLEGASRFVLEMLRVEPTVIGRFSLSMVLGIALVVLGAVLWVVFGQLGASISNAAPVPATALAEQARGA